MHKYFVFLMLFLTLSCQTTSDQLKEGHWQARLDLADGQILPFNFVSQPDGTLVIQNAEERILVDEVEISGQNIKIQAPVFEGYFQGTLSHDGNSISGDFIKPSLKRKVPFVMEYGIKERFSLSSEAKPATVDMSGDWETVFSPDTPKDRYVAKGIFKQQGNKLTGTFRTTTGDYRYLEGMVSDNRFMLSTFDGAHAFLFTGIATDSSLSGTFYSGNHWIEPFRARRNPNYELPDATTLTYLKEGYEAFEFAFENAEGEIITHNDAQFDNKVVLVQLLGSWCPNCMEEAQFYTEYLKTHPDLDIAIVGLAFEYAPTKQKAFNSINRMVDRLQIPYPILLAQYATEDKTLAQEKLPMLNQVLSYPTTIFIDKKGIVRRIHTGFNGKATADVYTAFAKEFDQFVTSLSREK